MIGPVNQNFGSVTETRQCFKIWSFDEALLVSYVVALQNVV